MEKLVAFAGTIPIEVRGAQYNIPVIIYIEYEFPTKPPLVFVRPTETMSIHPRHSICDSNGKVFNLPYLTSWDTRSHLCDLVLQMSTSFGISCPVYAKGSARGKKVPLPLLLTVKLIGANDDLVEVKLL
eukprot:UN33017